MPHQIFGSGLNGNIDAKSSALNSTPAAQVLSIIMMAPAPHCARRQQSPERRGLPWYGAWGFQKHDFSVWLHMFNDSAPISGSNHDVVTPSLLRIFYRNPDSVHRRCWSSTHDRPVDKSKNRIRNRRRPAGEQHAPAPPSSSHIASCKEKWVNVPAVHRTTRHWRDCASRAFWLHTVKDQRRSALNHAIYRAESYFLLRPAFTS